MARWIGGEHDAQYGEPWPQFRSRCASALQRLLDSAGPSQSIAVFTSGGTIACMCQVLLGLDDRHTAQLSWSFVNSAVTKIFYRPGKLALGYVNNYAHLEWRGQSGSVSYR
jgi:broad specificity phosphatase PhoE